MQHQEFGGREVREKAFEEEFNHPNFIHYLLRYDGVACATACLFISGNQARLESVATLEAISRKRLNWRLDSLYTKGSGKKGFRKPLGLSD